MEQKKQVTYFRSEPYLLGFIEIESENKYVRHGSDAENRFWIIKGWSNVIKAVENDTVSLGEKKTNTDETGCSKLVEVLSNNSFPEQQSILQKYFCRGASAADRSSGTNLQLAGLQFSGITSSNLN